MSDPLNLYLGIKTQTLVAAFFTGVGGMIIVSGVYTALIAWKNKIVATITGKKENSAE